MPINVEFAEDALENEPPVPLTIDQAPEPAVAVLAAKVAEVKPHKFDWSGPAFAVVGFNGNEITTSSLVAVQGALLMVQRKVLVLPAAAVNVATGLVVEEKDPPLPDTIDHEPVPDVGAFAVNGVEVCPHLV